MNVSTSSMKFRSRGFQVRAFLWWGRWRSGQERKKPKICTIYRKFVQITSFSLPHTSGNHRSDSAPRLWHSPGVSFTTVVSLRLPSSEGAAKQEPLRLIFTCSISTVPTSLRLRGRTPREGRPYGRIGRLFDKSEISDFPFSISAVYPLSRTIFISEKLIAN